MAPIQVRVLSVSQAVEGYAAEVEATLRARGVRVDSDLSAAKIGAKIREGTLAKIPYLLVLGGREAESRTVAVRRRGVGEDGTLPLGEFVDKILHEIRTKGLDAAQAAEG